MSTVGSIRRPFTAATDRRSTNARLAAGVAAGPVFIACAAIQGARRDGFHISRHPISALSVGDYGWAQVANFVVTGLLVVAAATGLRQTLPPTRRARVGTALVALHGAGFVAAGAFRTDAADGFPVGTPDGLPDTFTWHAIVHGIVAPLAFVTLAAAALVLAIPLGARFGARWRAASRAVPAGLVLAMVVPGLGGFSLRLAVVTAVALGWIAASSARSLRRW